MGLLDDADRIPPVWERLPQVFRYPFHPACLVALALYTGLYTLGLFLPLIGLFVVLLAYAGLFKFAADVLETTAHGHLVPPETQSSHTSWMLFKQIGLAVVFYLMVIAVALLTGSWFLSLLVSLLLVIAWPAAIMTLVMTDTFGAALNPVTWLEVMRRIGKAYFIAVLLLGMLAVSQGMAESFFARLAGFGVLGAAGGFLIGGYFLIASFHLIGYLVYEKHEALGVEIDTVSGPGAKSSGRSGLIEEAEAYLAAGEVDEAVRHLGSTLLRGGGEIEEHEFYRTLLKRQGREDALLEHAREYIPVLLYGREEPRKAMEVTRESLEMDPGFRPTDPALVVELARLLDRHECFESVLRLTSGFAREHPEHADLPENYYLAARALWFGRQDRERALKLLDQLIRRYPAHDRQADWKQLSRRIHYRIGLHSSPDAASPGTG